MKVLVVLALAVAVVSAGFTGSLNQQVRPHLQQAIQQIRADLALKAPARSSVEAAFQAKFLASLQEQVENHLNNLQTAMTQAQIIGQQVSTAMQTTIASLHELGNGAAQQAQDILAGLSATLQSLFRPQGRALSPAMQAIVGAVVTNPSFVTAVHNSAVYLCLKANDITVNYEMVQDITQSHGWEPFIEDPAVASCIAQFGGLQQMIEDSQMVNSIQAMVGPLGLTSIVHGLLYEHVPNYAAQIIAGLSARGLFSNIGNGIADLASGAWDHVSGAASGAWNAVQGGAGAFANMVSNMAVNVMASGAEKWEAMKEVAAAMLEQGIAGMAQLAADKAFELMAAMAPYASALGNTWTQAVDIYQSVHGLLNLGN